MPNSRTPHCRRRTSRKNPRFATTGAATLVSFTVLVAALTVLALANPGLAARMLRLPPTPTLFVLGPTNTPDPRGHLPPSWTPSYTPPSPPTLTPSHTPTLTMTPSATVPFPPTLTFTPLATLEPGWFEIEVPEARFALRLTNNWLPILLTDRDPGDALAEISRQDPIRAASIRDGLGQAVLDDLVLIAFDTASTTEPYVINLTVAYASPAEGESIDEVRDRHIALYEASDFYEFLAGDSVMVDGRLAHRLRYTTEFAGETERITVYHLEVIAKGHRRYAPILLFTLSAGKGQRNIYESLFDRIVATIRYTRIVIPPTPTSRPTLTSTREQTEMPSLTVTP